MRKSVLIMLLLCSPAFADEQNRPMPEGMNRTVDATETEELVSEIFQGCNGFGITNEAPAVDRFTNGLGYRIISQDNVSTILTTTRYEGVEVLLSSGGRITVCDATLSSDKWRVQEVYDALGLTFVSLQAGDQINNIEMVDDGVIWEHGEGYFGASVFESDGVVNFHYYKE